MKALVVGATGYMGRETVQQLIQAGMQVRAMTRAPEKADALRQLGADVVFGDLIDRSSLAKACQGVDYVVDAGHSLLGEGKYSSAAVDLHGKIDLIETAKAAMVKHFVFTSLLGVTPDSPVDFFRHKYAVEQHLQACGLDYTILRPPAFMEWHAHNFLGKDILEKGAVTILGQGENLTNFMAASDVAKFAVVALTNGRACNRILEIGGHDNITKNRLAQMYIKISGKPAKINHMPRPMMQLMSVVMRPFKPVVARIMLFSYLADTTPQSFHPDKILSEFPVDLLRLEDFVKMKVAEWRQLPQP